jgi:hypothetical protein
MPSATLRNWIVGLMSLLSLAVWFSITSSWAIILHATAKLGVATPGYGTVNLTLVILALIWSIGGWMAIVRVLALPLDMKALANFWTSIFAILLTISAIAFLLDEWLSQRALPGMLLELIELCSAIWIAWILVVRHRNVGPDLLISSLFGLLGLIGATAFVLAICPRVVFRV